MRGAMGFALLCEVLLLVSGCLGLPASTEAEPASQPLRRSQPGLSSFSVGLPYGARDLLESSIEAPRRYAAIGLEEYDGVPMQPGNRAKQAWCIQMEPAVTVGAYVEPYRMQGGAVIENAWVPGQRGWIETEWLLLLRRDSGLELYHPLAYETFGCGGLQGNVIHARRCDDC